MCYRMFYRLARLYLKQWQKIQEGHSSPYSENIKENNKKEDPEQHKPQQKSGMVAGSPEE